MAGPDIDRLRKIAALTASSSDGEALAALRKLQKALSDAGLDFADVVAHGATGRVPNAPRQTGNPFDDIFKAAADGFAQNFHRPQPRPQPPRTRSVDPTDMPEGTFSATVKKVDGSSETTTSGDPMIWVHVQDKGEREVIDYGVCVAFGATATRISDILGTEEFTGGTEGVRMTLKVLSQKSPKHRPMIISAHA